MTPARQRIVANVGVKDEGELIERNIAHLRSIGVDHIVVCDMYSADGTVDVLRRERARGGLTYFQMSDLESQEAWAQRNLEAAHEAGADWVVFIDADEFPIPASGSLHECAGLDEADVLVIDRFNVPTGPGGPAMPETLSPERYGELMVVAESIPSFWEHLRAHPGTSLTLKRLVPKVMVRPAKVDSLTLGVHDIVSSGDAALRRLNPADLIAIHLPVTTLRRFENKVRNIREVLVGHEDLFGKDQARHWRRWVAMADQGRLEDEFGRLVFGEQAFARAVERGIFRSVADIFCQRRTLAR